MLAMIAEEEGDQKDWKRHTNQKRSLGVNVRNSEFT